MPSVVVSLSLYACILSCSTEKALSRDAGRNDVNCVEPSTHAEFGESLLQQHTAQASGITLEKWHSPKDRLKHVVHKHNDAAHRSAYRPESKIVSLTRKKQDAEPSRHGHASEHQRHVSFQSRDHFAHARDSVGRRVAMIDHVMIVVGIALVLFCACRRCGNRQSASSLEQSCENAKDDSDMTQSEAVNSGGVGQRLQRQDKHMQDPSQLVKSKASYQKEPRKELPRFVNSQSQRPFHEEPSQVLNSNCAAAQHESTDDEPIVLEPAVGVKGQQRTVTAGRLVGAEHRIRENISTAGKKVDKLCRKRELKERASQEGKKEKSRIQTHQEVNAPSMLEEASQEPPESESGPCSEIDVEKQSKLPVLHCENAHEQDASDDLTMTEQTAPEQILDASGISVTTCIDEGNQQDTAPLVVETKEDAVKARRVRAQELIALKLKEQTRKKMERERLAAVNSFDNLARVAADKEAKHREDEQAAESMFKLLPYKLRNKAANTIGHSQWDSSTWSARLAAAQETDHEVVKKEAETDHEVVKKEASRAKDKGVKSSHKKTARSKSKPVEEAENSPAGNSEDHGSAPQPQMHLSDQDSAHEASTG